MRFRLRCLALSSTSISSKRNTPIITEPLWGGCYVYSFRDASLFSAHISFFFFSSLLFFLLFNFPFFCEIDNTLCWAQNTKHKTQSKWTKKHDTGLFALELFLKWYIGQNTRRINKLANNLLACFSHQDISSTCTAYLIHSALSCSFRSVWA